MKKIIVFTIAVYLFFMFLVYSGVFIDYTDPMAVTKYYFDCLKNREGFLTYKIYKSESFNEDKLGELYSKYKMHSIKKIELNFLGINYTRAFVEAKIIYKDKQVNYATVELEKSEKNWLIKKVGYKT